MLTRLNIICLKNSSLHYFKLFFTFTLNFEFGAAKPFFVFENGFRDEIMSPNVNLYMFRM